MVNRFKDYILVDEFDDLKEEGILEDNDCFLRVSGYGLFEKRDLKKISFPCCFLKDDRDYPHVATWRPCDSNDMLDACYDEMNYIDEIVAHLSQI
jgi:hypothetical protein